MAEEQSSAELEARTSDDAMVAVAQRVQVVLGAVALVALWLLDGVPTKDKAVVNALLLVVYLPWTILTPRMSRDAPRWVNLTVDLLAIGVFPLVIAETRVAVMIAFVLMVGYHAYVNGRAMALTVVAGVLGIVAVSEHLAPAGERLDAFTLVMYAATLIGFSVMLDALAAERRTLVRHLSRLNGALAAVAPNPDLDHTLNSVAHTAKEAVDASFVVVLLERDGRMDVSMQVTTRPLDDLASDEELQPLLDAIIDDPESTPSGLAIKTAAPVAVADVRVDRRFEKWWPIAEKLAIRSVVTVPLVNDEGCLGVLAAYWPTRGAFRADDVALLAAYSRQAALAVARAIAFERERDAALRLADADRMKSEFVARVSHELRTPLTAINGFLSTVLLHWDQLDEPSKKELLNRAGRNTTDLRRLVEQVLAFARTGDSSTALTTRPLALAAEVDSLVAHLLPVLGDHVVDVDVHPTLVVQADREALHHVLTNLLANAAKFSPTGSRIRISGRHAAGHIEIAVTDEGPGIDAAEQERIFDRFYRSSSVSAKGTGIGLSIVRSFVEQMGGTVGVRSHLGEGATFSFTLPLGAPESRPAQLVS
ncbi:MAG TPA: ATP-binding protein [Acidimicrobiales bacterium]|nr:ATP-binding protein [Acidimicrobiales bacterium]